MLRAYLDTSVFGGVYDAPFESASKALFRSVDTGRTIVMLGATTLAELSLAPERVRAVLAAVPRDRVVTCPITPAVEQLRDRYLLQKVLGPGSLDDATHVATATIHDADVVVSWNFKHIVNFDRIRLFNAINVGLGYKPLTIMSPLELEHGDPI